MSKTFIDKAFAVVPNLENRISLFHKKLRLAQYAEQSIYDYKVMGLKQPRGLVLPKVRKPKKLPRVLSQRSMARLIHCCGLYDKTLLALTYACALRVSEVCRLRWEDISFDRQMLFVCQSKGNKDRYVPISSQMLIVLKAFRKRYPSDDFVFKTHGRGVTP